MHIIFVTIFSLLSLSYVNTFVEEPPLPSLDVRQQVQEVVRETLKYEMDKLKQQYAENQTKLTHYIEQLKQEFDTNRADDQIQINALKHTVASLQTDKVQLEKGLNELQNKTEGMKTQSTAVGFTLGLSTMIATSEFDILKFPKVVSNYGNGYNITTGKFTCNVPGLYLFQVTIVSNSADASAHIVRNGTHLSYAYTSTEKSFDYFGGSVSAVLTLAKYDTVYVESDGDFFFGGNSFFSGVLISE